ncbi:hypothetical protein CEUSTIGMA_g13816.t1 [Chlamydomonas eustigma]|uniref:Pentraxin (PTX) domain-containing protein n=1 Tax=Chlamydomonas eustigma TaxID=1157962 RepID=A0A250XTN9_9CHLO|nr:hypothetical protein CEUSTIGMA_g13816.t1 [Chlamydomonas eustigma]|eukprot:GAX86406.1 hypothetical protein CEUSTIGMA_g13816.t1 [Chlamydomonas eustigma]
MHTDEDQDCYRGCFQASKSFTGDLANVRIYSRVLQQDEIRRNMARNNPGSVEGLVALFLFPSSPLSSADPFSALVSDKSGQGNSLQLRSQSPQFVYSTAPLTLSDGRPVKSPAPGSAGYSLALNDQQVVPE